MGVFTYDSPAGTLEIGTSENAVLFIDWLSNRRHARILNDVSSVLYPGEVPLLYDMVNEQLDAYFNKKIKEFIFPVMMLGTPFRLHIYRTMMEIPYGAVMTYGELARKAGMPHGVRAVASAVGRNPLNIIVPCHRIVAAGNRIGGYAGGVDSKRWLLKHEGSNAAC